MTQSIGLRLNHGIFWCGWDGSAGPDDSSAWPFAPIIPARS